MLLLMPIYTANAEEWKEVEVVPTVNGSTLEIKEEKEYQWYKIKKEGGYFKEAPSEEFTKTDFWTLTPWSEWGSEYPSGKDIVETKTIYHYRRMKKIKYIRLSEKNNSNFIFASIRIYSGKNEMPYKLEESGDEIILELKEPCYFDELEVEMTLTNRNKEENGFLIEWLYELDLPSCMQTYTRQWFTMSTQINFIERKMMPNEFLYEAEKISFDKVEENAHTTVYESEQYRYQERLDYYEKEIKEYSKGFSAVMIEGYPYPDLKTERKRFFCRFHKKEPEMKEILIIKEVPVEKNILKEIPVEKIILKEHPMNHLLEQDNALLKKDVENLKYRVASCQNEKSADVEKNKNSKKLEIKKQSLTLPFYIGIFVLGYLSGRIVAMKKKF